MNEYTNLLFAFFGGIAINTLSLTELRNIPRQERQETFSDWVYCIWFFGIPILGAGLTYAYQGSGITLNPLLSVNIGASTPLILKTLAATVPQIGKRNIN
ncbi:MAG: hypothetical protein P4L35_03105 [Ignavibacteriaceae bacterium]|nr:hypothetical protein [Ignavibacteriaceae bacterium]